MLLSVVIATFNRSNVLKQNLDCFKVQTDSHFEVVVAIDGSTDDTEDMLKNYEASFPIRWINTGESNKYCLPKARNMAIIESKGEVVVILDDDSFPVPDFISEHKSSVKKGVLTGGFRNSHDSNDELIPKMKKTLAKYGVKKECEITERVVENNSCMLRRDWVGCGMFSERFEAYGGCGQEFLDRLKYQGYKYQFNPDAMIYHHREFEGDNGLTREIKKGQARSAGTLVNKHSWSYK